MEQKAAVIDSVSVQRDTDTAIHYAEEIVKNAMGFLRDDKKKERLAKGECKFCYYIHSARIGGAAMTKRPCGICAEEVWYGSTATDKICLKCAVANELCKRCGADIRLRPRRLYKK